ncbi:CRISPR-associated endonuclease Cas6 [Tepidibacter thalassicus]|uniref:Uncharacterized protein n=1 Tax=Tepidibacter thalassicus DSM 15285 TaxID=1123350 RepID=A0A1M5TEI3_9FIRM|nr:CRISPR-associated endonuclease Cas6 [Tepidibacter thalassicus]SHH49091.1 hypothetical protein SAMN02744040_02137 [Tepidibacter thalassicus DSM 15285]
MQICLIKFETDENFRTRDVEKLRGYIANTFKEEIMVHNHISTFEFNYKMPKIQYKLIDKKLAIFGIEQGAEFIKNNCINVKEIDIEGKIIKNFRTQIIIDNKEFEVADELFSYKFITPWLALNQNNYLKFKKGEFDLNKQIQNNILSNFKDLGIKVNKKIIAKGDFKPIKIIMKDTELIGFKGDFVCNVKIPDYMGIGKRKSIGYGTVISN